MTHILQDADIFVTGGAGTLGRAIARRREKEKWSGKLTVYSSDDHKHDVMRRMFPDQRINYVQGDIRNAETLYAAMVGHDIVIHAAAVKVIPVSEEWCIDTIDVNIYGSETVCSVALRAGIKHVLGISTDKACHPANLYGATKMAMEKVFQEYARMEHDTKFHLVRYGNVLESTGSVIEAWKNSVARGEPIKITDPNMTRFWLSPSQAVQYVIDAIDPDGLPGAIYVPKMPALSIAKLLELTIVDEAYTTMSIPIRPGEKMHETLVTIEETKRGWEFEDCFYVRPSTCVYDPVYHLHMQEPYTSNIARELTTDELKTLLADG